MPPEAPPNTRFAAGLLVGCGALLVGLGIAGLISATAVAGTALAVVALLLACELGCCRVASAAGTAPTADALTGLLDAPGFRTFVHTTLGDAERPLALLYIELRHVEMLRSTFGREAVELLCQAIAGRLRAAVRQGDGLAHFGDGLFAIGLPGVGDRGQLTDIAQRLRAEVAHPLLLAGTRVRPNWEAAAVLAPEDGRTAADLLVAAESAREVARAGDGVPLRSLPRASCEALSKRRSRHRELLEAREARAFFPTFQPQLDFRTNRIDRVEVLMRWQRADGRVAGPGEFMDELRILDALPAVSRDVYATAFAEAALWRDHGFALERLALNLDATQVADEYWAEDLLSFIAEGPLSAERIEFEVSENILQHADGALLRRGLTTLRGAGVLVSLDDFGTGFASLSQIAELPIDLVKLDAHLLWDATVTARTQIVVEGIVALVDRLDLPCVFEGIETAAQLALARRFGGVFGQGFFIGRPMQAPELEPLLAPAATLRPLAMAAPLACPLQPTR